MTLTLETRRMLEASAIPIAFALELGVRSVTEPWELPEDLKIHSGALPGVVFPWYGADGVQHQLRPDVPVEIDGKPRKYLQPAGVQLVSVLGDPTAATRVFIVEGTKQALAARACALQDVLVIGISGCHNAMKDGVLLPVIADLVEDMPVTVFFDADVSTNGKVLLAAQRLHQALELEGAISVGFVLLPADGKDKTGLDDLLGQRLPEKRAKFLDRLAKRAVPQLPKHVAEQSLGDDPRPQLNVTADRLHLIQDIVTAMLGRWDGWRLFNHGDVVTELKDARTTPLDRGLLLGVLAETAYFYRPTQGGPKPAWPDGNVVQAVAAKAFRFTPLDRVSRAPFVRADGTICQTPGYDQASRTFLVEDVTLQGICVPDSPTAAEVQAAVRLLLDEWFGDMPLHEEADRANLLALVLTPFIRGLVPLAPLAVIDGLQMGVGKNLTADCIALVCTGSNADPLPYPNDDDELRKVITSTFGTGAELFVFDEAHCLQGKSLSRALTATTYNDRILGVSRMARYPNSVTWMALGNQVQVFGDVARRVYRIGLRPTGANPERRDADQFRHPDLRKWTRENRPSLVQAALTLVRAWFAAGQPPAPRAVSFGSFESWERIVGGILHHAGVPGFLGNLSRWRGEADFETGYWTDHLHDLWVQFGEEKFTVREVVDAIKSGGITELPPDLYSHGSVGYSRELGRAYAKVKDRWFSGYRLVIAGLAGAGGARGRVNTWRIERQEDQPTPDPEGSEGREGTPNTHITQTPLPRPALTAVPAPVRVRETAHDPSSPSHPSPASEATALRLDAAEDVTARLGRSTQIADAMSATGLRVDAPLLYERVESISNERRRLQMELTASFGFPLTRSDGRAAAAPWVTRNGTAHLGTLTSGTGWPLRRGVPRLDQQTLQSVQASVSDAQIRRLATIIEALQRPHDFEFSLSKHTKQGRVHPTYSADTATGRWTATSPNVLGVGRRTPELLAQRDYILAEPDHVFIGLDLDGIDARVAAGLSGDSGYADLLVPGVDIHAHMSTLFFGHDGRRDEAKAITYGLNYGQGAASLAEQLGRPVEEIQSLIDRFFGKYPLLRAWQDKMRYAAAAGWVPTGTGRRVEVDPAQAWTAGPARAAQATAHDLATVGLLRLAGAGMTQNLRLFLHDEVVLSVPQGAAGEFIDRARSLMSFMWESPSGLAVSITATPHATSGQRWSDLYRKPAQALAS